MNISNVYSEVVAILDVVEPNYIDRLPKKLINFFKEKKSKDYYPKYIVEKDLKDQDFERETFVVISILNLKYWCQNAEEKSKLEQIYIRNGQKHQEEIREKYDIDKMFSVKENTLDEKQQNSIIEYKETTFFEKILNMIKNIFK